ncbi:MAG: DUF1847 domain-containing protein [Desulfovibrionaceae bacterium]|nr:DUF1847 domain-containing protein [Desulfovibrionaceae bacterium]
MPSETSHTCSDCAARPCRSRDEAKYPPFCLTKNVDKELLDEVLKLYAENQELRRIAATSACIEGEFYGRMSRVEETIEFIKRMNYQYVGIASCVGLLPEARIFKKILDAHGIRSYTVGCKIGAVDKGFIGIPPEKKLNRGCGHESMCNPIMQAKELEKEGTDFNIVIGLCVGHDTLFLKYSAVPTTVLIVKDRVYAHNPAAALYTATSMYSRFKKELGL